MPQEAVSSGNVEFENEAICMNAAGKVIHEFVRIPKRLAVFPSFTISLAQ